MRGAVAPYLNIKVSVLTFKECALICRRTIYTREPLLLQQPLTSHLCSLAPCPDCLHIRPKAIKMDPSGLVSFDQNLSFLKTKTQQNRNPRQITALILTEIDDPTGQKELYFDLWARHWKRSFHCELLINLIEKSPIMNALVIQLGLRMDSQSSYFGTNTPYKWYHISLKVKFQN